MAKSKELKVETPVVETKKSTETKNVEKKHIETAAQKKAPVKEEPVENEQGKDTAAAKKAPAKPKKPAKEKGSVTPEVFIQYQERQADIADVVARVKEIYVSQKHRESSIKSLQIYIKPQDGLEGKGKVYYVINNKIQGDLDLF